MYSFNWYHIEPSTKILLKDFSFLVQKMQICETKWRDKFSHVFEWLAEKYALINTNYQGFSKSI